jgi:LmbE family N-acetylglucosaminyl deacetylase
VSAINLLRGFIRIRPRALVDSLLTYPRFLGTIKPQLLGLVDAELSARTHSLRTAWWPRVLECPVGKRMLVVAPHPDDETIGPGGLLLRHRGLAELHVITVFNGEGGGRLERGPWENTLEYKAELVATRRNELERVAAVLEVASMQRLDVPDGTMDLQSGLVLQLRAAVERVSPDIVLLPWYLDALRDHRVTNVLYAWGCAHLSCTVLAYEVWQMLEPNAVLDITDQLDEKLALVTRYQSQTATVDYLGFVEGIAKTRAFYSPVRTNRGGAAEAYLALPNADYCDLVTSVYGMNGQLSMDARRLLA